VTAGLDNLAPAVVSERLHRARVARIGYVDADGPAIVPVNIAVDAQERIVFRTAADGPLARLDHQQVAIEIDGIDAGRRAGWSILARGIARDVTDALDATAVTARAQQVDSWAPGVRDRKFVVVPLAITGRTIPVGPDGDWFAGIPVS
jgi:nitroimidazol reductase NimA-like FMN-containing flavoprotein (pyridoxamine 5'-phosphate oxidase superfamily)